MLLGILTRKGPAYRTGLQDMPLEFGDALLVSVRRSSLDISPQLLMMTVAISAPSSFASQLSHPAHLLVMGPGGYRLTDYVKVRIPLTVVVICLCVWLVPVFWPP